MSLTQALATIAPVALPAVEKLIEGISNQPPDLQAVIAQRLAFVLAEETASDAALNALLAKVKGA